MLAYKFLGLSGSDDARKLWKKLKNYHRKSLGETAMFRFKKIFGGYLKSREIGRQKAEIRAKCRRCCIKEGSKCDDGSSFAYKGMML